MCYNYSLSLTFHESPQGPGVLRERNTVPGGSSSESKGSRIWALSGKVIWGGRRAAPPSPTPGVGRPGLSSSAHRAVSASGGAGARPHCPASSAARLAPEAPGPAGARPRPPRAAGGCGRGLGAAAAPPPSFRLPLLRRSVVPSFLLLSHASRHGAERPDRQLHLKIPEAVPAMEEDQELERKMSGLKTSVAEGERKTALEMVQAAGTDRHCVTFVLHEEDHTLGNSLRYMIMKNPEVEFCGYTTTHPSESKINLRIQTRGALPAVEPFQRGLNELMNVCQHVLDKFEASIKEYKDQKASRNESTF